MNIGGRRKVKFGDGQEDVAHEDEDDDDEGIRRVLHHSRGIYCMSRK